MIDARQLDPELFLQSDDAGEIIFAVLAGSSSPEQKMDIIRRIFDKLQMLFGNDTSALLTKIRQLEMLSLLRGKTIQQIILKEENNMPITIDITQDLRYQQGVEEGKEETVEGMFKNGLSISLVQNITGLPLGKLEDILKKVNDKNLSA